MFRYGQQWPLGTCQKWLPECRHPRSTRAGRERLPRNYCFRPCESRLGTALSCPPIPAGLPEDITQGSRLGCPCVDCHHPRLVRVGEMVVAARAFLSIQPSRRSLCIASPLPMCVWYTLQARTPSNSIGDFSPPAQPRPLGQTPAQRRVRSAVRGDAHGQRV